MKFLVPTLVDGQPRLQPTPQLLAPLSLEDALLLDAEIAEAIEEVTHLKEMWDRAREAGEE